MDNDKQELAEDVRGSRPRLEKLRPAAPAYRQLKDMLQPVAVGKEETLRRTGIDILGNVPWGTHFCLFYHTKQDLIDILVPYFKAGLENNEFCMWVTSEPLKTEDAKQALKRTVRNLDAYINKGQIQFLDYSDWYTRTGAFDADSVLQGWVQKHDQALKNGFDGLRATGNTLWLEKKEWAKFTDYEAVVNSVIGKYKMLAICTYSLDKCGASEILDVEHNHQFALIKWRGDWKILESSDRNQVEARLAEQTAIAQALERSKKEWVETFNAMSDWVVLIDLKGRILRTNRAGENFLGKTLDEIIGQSCCKLVHGSDKYIPGCPLRIMLHTRQQATVELKIPNMSRWLMVTTDPVINEKGNLIGAVHITRDITERKKDEKALRESEERYKYLFEQSPLGISLATPDGKVVRVNKTMEVITEYFEQELKRINLADTFENPEDWKRLLETIDRYGCAVDFPTRLKRKDATVYDALLNVSRVHLAGQDLFQIICTDVTECKKAEEALRESEQKISQVVQESSVATFVIDSSHVITHWNKACENLTGVPAKQVIGTKTHWQAFYLAERPVMADFVAANASDKEIAKYYGGKYRKSALIEGACEAEDFFPNLGEAGKWLFFTATPLRNTEGKVVGAIETLQDITERKKAEAELKQYQFIVESAHDAIFFKDLESRYIVANNKALEAFGLSRDKVIGKNDYQILRNKEEARKNIEDDNSVFKTGKVTEITKQMTAANGKHCWFQAIKAPQFDNQGNIIGLIGIARDITERKRAAAVLRESEKAAAKGQLAAQIAHEINNPLAGIKNSLLLIKDAIPDDHPDYQYLALIDKEIKRISDIVRQMFDFYRPSEARVSEFSVDDAIREVATLLEANCRAHNVIIGIGGKSALVKLPEALFQQVLYNIVKNAIEASPQGGEVEITSAISEDVLTVTVSDQGDGIPERVQPHIFEPLFTTKKGITTAGLGLGLSVSKNIVETLDGSLYFDSKTGKGTVFSIVIPIGGDRKGVQNG